MQENTSFVSSEMVSMSFNRANIFSNIMAFKKEVLLDSMVKSTRIKYNVNLYIVVINNVQDNYKFVNL